MIKIQYSLLSLRDIDEIYEYGRLQYGFERADLYVTAIEHDIDLLLTYPELGIKALGYKDVRKYPSQDHIIYYRFIGSDITIERLLHRAAQAPI